mmetsp:Transcript_78322/g.138346  ORF Transcript_78322/g.138346 Transcript_78322/m.138346 type:complete len:99 (+) Transcript_78322:178-474(+)
MGVYVIHIRKAFEMGYSMMQFLGTNTQGCRGAIGLKKEPIIPDLSTLAAEEILLVASYPPWPILVRKALFGGYPNVPYSPHLSLTCKKFFTDYWKNAS